MIKKLPHFSDAQILAARPAKESVDPRRPYACLLEEEYSAHGKIEQVATIFLTNRECPFRCLMCDLWQNTTDKTVPVDAIVEQIDHALGQAEQQFGSLAKLHQIKLYNAGSFFDAQAIPHAEDKLIAANAEIGMAKADFYPQVHLISSLKKN